MNENEYPNLISVTRAAKIIGTAPARLRSAIESGKMPIAIDLSIPEDTRPYYKVVTKKLFNYINGDVEHEQENGKIN